MAEIGFYHLTRSGADAALPALLGRTLAAGERAVVRCATADRLAALDQSLWLCPTPDWLPHGTEHGPLQPIWLTLADDRPNGARFLFLVDDAEPGTIDGFTRVFTLFDGNDTDAVQAARRRWAGWKRDGHALTYWQQSATGWSRAG